ncbi:hypothetical protein GUITHDRAFT_102579 [Guillardia theta CCMP2712]|uniref:Dynein axonemal light chain 1 n=1 Tax=Guillardia theta (strain CCMP2712) TaxID=905079 RepID=L1JU74_GUITC|nr:hypothetical protein GUITHDRAFT_102579 [Guillardia theta CCMP2712]EKX51967.1 hypothetical protein GUITHDRAFT_102579 [Guillardia theta CCMP2712]|eukprot:XP_005838947.1 hypothetical protein GUITHDRAFT_102579 [Guillardia theta CCMP2712]
MTSIKDAIKNFETKSGTPEEPCVAAEQEKVLLFGQMPPIVKMDNTLSTLKACKHLALSSNCIEKITGIKGCESLEVLSLGRNQIKKLDGVEDVSETLQELWISYNLLTSLRGVEKLSKLRVLYVANNLVAKLPELDVLKECKLLEELLLVGNPIWDELSKPGGPEDFREQIAGRVPWLKKLDGSPLTEEEKTAGAEKVP